MTGQTTTTQGEALEARARIANAITDHEGGAIPDHVPVLIDAGDLRAITAALQPNIDHAVGGVRSEPVAWRTEYRDVYKGRDTGWRYVYHSNKPNPGQVTRDGCGHRNVTPLYATPPLDNNGLDAATRVRGPRNCTCHPDDQPPGGCRRKFASNECQADAAEYGLRGAIERIADVSERWENSLVSQINEIARAALSAPQQPVKLDAVREALGQWGPIDVVDNGLTALSEALFFLSDKLRSSGFLASAEHHQKYEAVVAEYQKLRASIRALNTGAATPPLDNTGLDAATVLLEALQPFSDACTISNADDDSNIDDTLAACKITWADLRRARAAIARYRKEERR